jgi:hypothetical protein
MDLNGLLLSARRLQQRVAASCYLTQARAHLDDGISFLDALSWRGIDAYAYAHITCIERMIFERD